MRKKRAKITRKRIAGPRHAVVTVHGHGGYRREPCAQCPWRKDVPVGVFPAEAFRISAPVAYDAAWSTFGCHMSKHAAPLTCAGFLKSPAALDNILVRLALADGRLDLDQVRSAVQLFETYRQMAVANGVEPDDVALALCRERSRE